MIIYKYIDENTKNLIYSKKILSNYKLIEKIKMEKVMDKQELENKIIEIIKSNQDITLIDDLLLDIPNDKELFYKYKLNEENSILEALNENKTRIKRALKVQLYKQGTTQSLLELNKILNQEENNNKITDYINNLVERWQTNEH